MSTLVLCGFMGCGKSTLGRRLSAALGYAFVDTDEMLVRQTGMSIKEMFAAGGESYFRDREHEVIQQAARMTETVIATGGGVMTFERNAALLSEKALIIYIDRSFDACYACISKRKNRPIGQRSRAELLDLYESRRSAYMRYADLILPNNASADDAVQRALTWFHSL